MNDDQLRSELERRAASAASRPDWSKRDLLPAVWHEIDTRPAPVLTSRWSMGVGAAAVVAALLILVVAVPRLAPQPPLSSGSPEVSPTASPNHAMSPVEFFEGWRSGDLRGRTVLVEGSIGEAFTTVQGRPPCDPPNPCPWGSLLGIDPGLAVYARQFAVPTGGEGLEVDAWAWHNWSLPEVPVSGILVMSVQDDGMAVFEGLVRSPTTALEWALSDAATLDIATFSPSDVAIVRGHLFDPYPRDKVRFCSVQTHPDLVGLPSRFCAIQDYLGDEVWGVTDLPRGAYLEVQAGAADSFGGDEEALYAVSPRLYGGGCEGEPPCWFWDVVARVDEAPRPEPTPAPTPPLAPSPTPTDGARGALTCSDEPETPASLNDHTGSVLGCSAELGNEPLTSYVEVSNPGGDAHVLRVTIGLAPCSVNTVAMDLWQPPPGTSLGESFRPSHALRIDRVTEGACISHAAPEITSETFTVRLDTALDASNVSAFVTTGPHGTNTVETHGRRFALTLEAGRETYEAGAAIDVSATSTYLGTDPTAVAGYGIWFGFEQLDGTLEMYPGSTLMCGGIRTLQPDEQLTRAYSKSGGWSGADPNAAFYRDYMRDPELHLPPGVYRIFAGLDWANESCGGEPVRVVASIVIYVAPASADATQTPDASPATPSDAIECDGEGLATTILGAGDLVVSCAHVDSSGFTDDGSGVQLVEVAGDPPRVRILWRSSICTDAVSMTVAGNSDRALFVVSPSASCIAPEFRIDAIELVLSRPLEVGAARLVTVPGGV